jgi:peroxiredoxin
MLRHSRMLALGTPAPAFALPDASARVHTLDRIAGQQPLLVAFICNHCPFVQHIIGSFARFAQEYQPKGLAVVAISSNDVRAHPEDSPAEMARFAAQHGFTFPYLYDESQQVALSYGAICTPDFFLFDTRRQLAYRGQFDGSRPYTEWDEKFGKPRNVVPCDGVDMRVAADAVLAGRVPPQQVASTGCSIKWKAENEPDWA